MDSILTSIKKLLGIQEEYTSFDADITIHINTVFGILNQLGVGPISGFSIIDKSTTWDEYTTSLSHEMVKTFIYLKVRLMFDPPTSGVLLDSVNRTLSELEWRLAIGEDKLTPPEPTDPEI